MTTATSIPSQETAREVLASFWWMPLVRGILLILFGLIMLFSPGSTLLSLIWLLGIYWIVDGIFGIFEGLRGHTERSRLWAIVGGVLGIVAGLIIVSNPIVAGVIGATFIAVLIGVTTVANGIMMIFAGRNGEWTWWGLVMGILYVLFGIFMFAHPLATVGALVWLFGFWAIVAGVAAIFLAFRVRGLAKAEQTS
ncbi:MAG: hypothetical protein GYB68_17135 [Chloroflexi bacterium]|nr:hypothetical protein [Chloroflexota bacterium]